MCNAKKVFGPAIGGSLLLTGGDPIPGLVNNAVNKAAPSNDLVKFLAPGGAMQHRIDEGEGRTLGMVGDPWAAFTKTKAQKDALAWQAGAADRAAADALTASNNTLASLRARRRIAAGLTTGAVGGSGSLSTVMAYGRSTLG